MSFIKNLSVSQFHNKNQFRIDCGEIVYLQSYESLVCAYDTKNSVLYLGEDWDYSNTTRKHVYMFIDEVVSDVIICQVYWKKNKRAFIQSLIDSGHIKHLED